MMKKSRLAAFALPAVLMAFPAFAQAETLPQTPLIVVEDHGGKSALPYYQAIRPLPEKTTPPAKPLRRGETAMLPVRASRLSPGREPRRALQTPVWSKPVFLVGDDETSRRWLKANGARLKSLGAVGLVVQVETVEALARLRAQAPELLMAPVSGDDLAKRLGISHYPVLISASGIEP